VYTPSMRQPSAFLPLTLSLAALCIVVVHFLVFGIVQDADEGAAAHTFQLLMAAQLPLIGFFAVKWLPLASRKALLILALQLGAATVPILAVVYLT